MNPVFWLLVILALVLVWFCLGTCFKSAGGFLYNLFTRASEGMKDNETEDKI